MPSAVAETERRVLARWPGLCCPLCRAPLHEEGSELRCSSASCGRGFPIVDGAPALLGGDFSLFDPPAAARPRPRRPAWLRRLLPRLSRNPVTRRNYRRFVDRLLARGPRPRVLVVGGGRAGEGMARALADPRVEWVETDVAPGERARLFCDAHRVPFEDASFDGLVFQAVLEHVLEPERAVAEAWRTLVPGGLLYAETPFLQQVHAGAYDFTRYTHLGHRRLFRRFEEIDSGAAGGPGMALAWAWRGFCTSWFRGRRMRAAAAVFAHLTAWWAPLADGWLVRRRGAIDCASAYYFLGAKSDRTLGDRELIAGYRGLDGQ
jgi:SAM-dependent methyltransferase